MGNTHGFGDGLRIGAVNYLNTKPLVHTLERQLPTASIVFDLPSRLADGLAQGRLDIALVPSMELFEDPRYRVISDACIACRGPVLSVKLFFRVPPNQVKSLALDEGSRTSRALAQMLLAHQCGVHPKLYTLPIGNGLRSAESDAVLLIGDRAIYESGDDFVEVWDLGDRWCRWTELPFVFAMWVSRPDVQIGNLEQALASSRDDGVAAVATVAQEQALAMQLPVDLCLKYLSENLYFRLGERERKGLNLFYRRAVEMDLAPAGWEWTFDGCAARN